MANSVETLWENVEEKAPDELTDGECHGPLPVRPMPTIILVAKGHARFIKGDEPAVRDGNAVGVAREIGKFRRWTSERRLGVEDPILFSKWRDIAQERTPLVQRGSVAEELYPVGKMKLDQLGQEQPAK